MPFVLTSLLETAPASGLPASATPIWVPLLLAGLVMLLFWWGMTRGRVPDENFPNGQTDAFTAAHHTGADHHEATAVHRSAAAHSADDLQRIEGIGPAIAELLAASGIDTFSRLAATDEQTLVSILRDAGLNLADPETWPEQAQLAAAGQWEALAALKEELMAGKRPD